MNTNAGKGTIAVYTNPDISITNNSDKNLVLQGLDTGKTGAGAVHLRATASHGWSELTGDTYTPQTANIKYNFWRAILPASSRPIPRREKALGRKLDGLDHP